MDLFDQMTTFVKIVEAGSLSAAARTRSMSLAAISRQLGALEGELGAPLVARTTRRLHVTDEGRRFYARCVRVLREIEDARADVVDTGDIRGTLVVSAPVSIGVHCVVPRLPSLSREHPSLSIDLRLEDRIVDLVGDGVDVAIRGGVEPPNSTSLVAHPVLSFERWVVASPAYLRRKRAAAHPDDLARHDALLQRAPAGAPQTWLLHRGDERHEAVVRGRLTCNAPLALREWCLADAGVALLPPWLVEADIAAGHLRRVLPEWSGPEVRAWAIYRVDLRRSPRVKAFLDVLSHDRGARDHGR